MRAEYDSKARAIWIALGPEPEGAGGDTVDFPAGTAVMVDAGDRPYGVELVDPTPDLAGLPEAAERFGLDREALEAAARAAIAAPDRAVTVEVGLRADGGAEWPGRGPLSPEQKRAVDEALNASGARRP